MANKKRLIDVNRLKGALREVIIEEKQQNNAFIPNSKADQRRNKPFQKKGKAKK